MNACHPYEKNSNEYNFFFHPLHNAKKNPVKAIVAVIINIALSILSFGLWQIPFWIINRLDQKKIEVWSLNSSSSNGQLPVIPSEDSRGKDPDQLKPIVTNDIENLPEKTSLARIIATTPVFPLEETGRLEQEKELPLKVQGTTELSPSVFQATNHVKKGVEINWNEIILNKLLKENKNFGEPVFSAKYAAKKLIIKVVPINEFEILSKLDTNPYVVSLLHTGESSDLKKAQISNKINTTIPENNKKVVVMEKLNPSDLHEPESLSEFDIYHFVNQKKISSPPQILLSKKVIQDMIQIAKIIQFLHAKNISHGDIKQDNFGRDNEGNLKIFDFGLSIDFAKSNDPSNCGCYKLSPKQNDMLAIGKLYINMLVNSHFACTNIHYFNVSTEIKQSDFQNVVAYLSIPEALKGILNNLLVISDPYHSDLLGRTIEELSCLKLKIP